LAGFRHDPAVVVTACGSYARVNSYQDEAKRPAMQPQWKNGNRITLVPDSERLIPELLEAIDYAQASVWFEQRLAESWPIKRNDWARRPNAQRYRERLAAMISAWLAGLR
jgi:hypothetical protein